MYVCWNRGVNKSKYTVIDYDIFRQKLTDSISNIIKCAISQSFELITIAPVQKNGGKSTYLQIIFLFCENRRKVSAVR